MSGRIRAAVRRARPPSVLLVVAWAAPVVPLVVALLARRHPAWVPDLDLALTELRVRDVGTAHTPLVGLPGRIGDLSRQGSHPGPISFYLLAPTYRLLGGSAFALQAATVLLHAAAVATTIVLVARTAGARWALAAGAALGLLVAGIGPEVFTEPWNPHLPLLWWPAFLAACLAVWTGDGAALPAVAVSGAICGQTHLSYLGAVAVLTAATLAIAAWWPRPSGRPRPGALQAGATLAVIALLWLPPVIDQLRNEPANGTLLVEHLLQPDERPLGWRTGARLVLERLDLVHLASTAVDDPGQLGSTAPPTGSAWRGAAVAAAVVLALVLAARRRTAGVAAAAGLLAAGALALAVVSVSRIVGPPWPYLLLFVWTVGLLAALSTAALLAGSAPRARGVLTPLLVVVLVGVSVRAGVAAADAEPTNPVVSRTVLALADDLEAELDPDLRYLVTWTDAIHLGGHGYGMVVELERRGFDVVVADGFSVPFGRHRSAAERPPDARLVVASGEAVAAWTAAPGTDVLASVDVRTRTEVAEATEVEAELVAGLERAGLAALVPAIEENLLTLVFEPRVPEHLRPLVHRLDELGAPAAVLGAPLDAPPPPAA